jgi:hypothetical protein
MDNFLPNILSAIFEYIEYTVQAANYANWKIFRNLILTN